MVSGARSIQAVFHRPEKPNPRPRGFESGLCPKAHHVRDPHQLAPPGTFLHQAGDQTRLHLPPTCFPTSTTQRKPVSNMGGEGREVHVSTITGEEREAAGSQELLQSVNEQMRHVLR